MDALDPRHGTYSGSQAHINERTPMCHPCHTAHLRYRRQRRYDIAQGKQRTVAAWPVIEHLRNLRKRGATVRHIAQRAGVSDSLIDELLNRPRATIRTDNANALLGTNVPASPTGNVPAIGTIRRIRALGRLGWGMRDISAAAGGRAKLETLRRINSLEPAVVKPSTAAGVADAYATLCMVLPPQGRTPSQVRARSVAKGWVPPLAWDDIDDPDEQPNRGRDLYSAPQGSYDEAVVVRILNGDFRLRSTVLERAEVVRRWPGSRNDLALHTGWRVERYTERESA